MSWPRCGNSSPTDRAGDLRGVFTRIADRSPDAAARWYAVPVKAIAELETLPELHPTAQVESEQLGLSLRQMLYGRRRNV